MGLGLEEAHGHYRHLGETWNLELEKELVAASDLGPHGEDHSGTPELGKEPCRMACTYCCGKNGRKHNNNIKYDFREKTIINIIPPPKKVVFFTCFCYFGSFFTLNGHTII